MFKKKDKVDSTKIYDAPVSRVFEINGHKLTITIKDSLYSDDTLLDDVVINDMFNDVARAVKGKATKYNPLPTSIVISHGNTSPEPFLL